MLKTGERKKTKQTKHFRLKRHNKHESIITIT